MSFVHPGDATSSRRPSLLAASLATVAVLAASGIAPALADPSDGPGACVSGYVPREARPGDSVCVTPHTRDTVAAENSDSGANKDPGGAYGPESCAQGFVWRQAFDGDTVCVTPAVRSSTLADNAAANSRLAVSHSTQGPAETGTVLYEVYANRPGVEVDEVDVDFLDNKLTDVQLPFQRNDALPAPGSSLRLRAYGNGQDRIGCRITVNGRKVAESMNGPVAICSGTA